MKNPNIKTYSTYNEINKNNKDVMEISKECFESLPQSEKEEYKYLMTKDKSKINPPKNPTDHELLLLILSKVEKLEEFKVNQEKFNQYLVDRFDKLDSRVDKLIKLNNLKE